jgi:hypothetical protein
MDAKNRVIHLDRKQLATVQDLTAESLQMERGSTLEERQGKRGRTHIPHAEFRIVEDAKRQHVDMLTNHIFDVQKFNIDLLDEKDKKDEAFHAAAVAYAKERQALKESGEAKQADYQKLKREHEAKITELKAAHVELASIKEELVKANEKALKSSQNSRDWSAWGNEIKKQLAPAETVSELRANHKTEIEKLKADYAKERQALKESGEAKQADYQRLKREHEAALVELKAEKKENVEAVQVVTALLKQRSAAQATQKPVEPPKPAQAGVTTTMSEKEYREALGKHKARLEAAEGKIQEIRQAYLDELIEEARKKGMESFAKAKAHEAVLSAHEAAKPLFAGRAAWAERLEELKKQDAVNRATHEANRVQHDKLRAGKLPEGFEQIARERVEASHTGIYAAIAATRRTVDEMENRLQFVQETKRGSGGARRGLDSGMER